MSKPFYIIDPVSAMYGSLTTALFLVFRFAILRLWINTGYVVISSVQDLMIFVLSGKLLIILFYGGFLKLFFIFSL